MKPMKLKQMVCDLKLAERLKNAGVEQESMFYYVYRPERNKLAEECTSIEYAAEKWGVKRSGIWKKDGIRVTSAFTSEELALKIPENVSHTKRYSGRFFVYFLDSQGEIVNYEADKTESNARAKMLLNLIQHKFIKQ